MNFLYVKKNPFTAKVKYKSVIAPIFGIPTTGISKLHS